MYPTRRQFLGGLGSVPAFGPWLQTSSVNSTSQKQIVSYGRDRDEIRYYSFSAAGLASALSGIDEGLIGLPGGVLDLDREWVINDNITIRGIGTSATQFRPTSSFPDGGTAFKFNTDGDGANSQGLAYVGIQNEFGGGAGRVDTGVEYNYLKSPHNVLRYLYLHEINKDGLVIRNTTGGLAEQIYVPDAGRYGIRVEGPTSGSLKLTNPMITGTENHALYITGNSVERVALQGGFLDRKNHGSGDGLHIEGAWNVTGWVNAIRQAPEAAVRFIDDQQRPARDCDIRVGMVKDCTRAVRFDYAKDCRCQVNANVGTRYADIHFGDEQKRCRANFPQSQLAINWGGTAPVVNNIGVSRSYGQPDATQYSPGTFVQDDGAIYLKTVYDSSLIEL